MNIRKVVNSMLTIEERLWHFEKKGLKSADFYRLVKGGQLGDMDGRNDMTDLLEWLGLNVRSVVINWSTLPLTGAWRKGWPTFWEVLAKPCMSSKLNGGRTRLGVYVVWLPS